MEIKWDIRELNQMFQKVQLTANLHQNSAR